MPCCTAARGTEHSCGVHTSHGKYASPQDACEDPPLSDLVRAANNQMPTVSRHVHLRDMFLLPQYVRVHVHVNLRRPDAQIDAARPLHYLGSRGNFSPPRITTPDTLARSAPPVCTVALV